MAKPKIVLAYSGGLDTTVAVPWLQEKYDADIITLTIDLGMVDLESIRQRALSIGATEALTVDGKDTLVNEFLFPSLQAGTIYEDQYPLATALGRPLIARYLVQAAREHGAYAIAHGCTGKGNDQVRLEVGIAALGPDIDVIAPIRDWGMSREDEIEYGLARNLPINANRSRFSTDENLWGRSVEAGELEDPWQEPPEDAYAWTSPVSGTPDEPAFIEIHFECGVPTAVDGETMAGTDLVGHLNTLAGRHGIGRIDHVENRLVGIKSREIYECPAATVLHTAHSSLEQPVAIALERRDEDLILVAEGVVPAVARNSGALDEVGDVASVVALAPEDAHRTVEGRLAIEFSLACHEFRIVVLKLACQRISASGRTTLR